MFSVSDLLQPERPDPHPVSDHRRCHARAGAHPGRGGGAQGRLQQWGNYCTQEQMQVSSPTLRLLFQILCVKKYLQGGHDHADGGATVQVWQ